MKTNSTQINKYTQSLDLIVGDVGVKAIFAVIRGTSFRRHLVFLTFLPFFSYLTDVSPSPSIYFLHFYFVNSSPNWRLVVHYQWLLPTLVGLSEAKDLLLGGFWVRGLRPRDPAACLLNLRVAAAELLPARAHLTSRPAVCQPTISLGPLWPLDYWLYEPLCLNEGLGSR